MNTKPKSNEINYSRDNLKTIQQKYGHSDPHLRTFKNLFSEDEWIALKAMNPKGRTLTPKQIKFIKLILGDWDE